MRTALGEHDIRRIGIVSILKKAVRLGIVPPFYGYWMPTDEAEIVADIPSDTKDRVGDDVDVKLCHQVEERIRAEDMRGI